MREIKFRAFICGRYYYNVDLRYEINSKKYFIFLRNEAVTNDLIEITDKNCLEYFIGLHDNTGKEWYVEDIGEFDNGDRFIIKMEDYLKVYIEWIGDVECEDQARDLYRIEHARCIGNTHQNPDLLKSN